MSRQDVNRAAEMEVFVHAVEAGGFSAAARALGMTPSAVSKLVARLEARLGTRLLQRSTRALQLTAEGCVFYERSRRVLSAVQMPGYEDRRIDQLSGGQRQRVAVARAIVFEPDIILMDEPLSALDKKLREELQIELKHLHRRLGSTTIYVTHDQKEALTLSDRIAVMNRGQIVQIAKPQEMYEKPASAFVADFIGYSLLLPIASSDSSSADKSQLGALASNAGALLVVRPEKLDIVSEDHRQPGHFYFTSEVKDVVYQGDIVMVYARLKTGENIVVRRDSRFATLQTLPRCGSPMRLALHQSDTSLVTDDRAGVAPLVS